MKKNVKDLKIVKPFRWLNEKRKKINDYISSSFHDSQKGMLITSIIISTLIMYGVIDMFLPIIPAFFNAILSLLGALLLGELFGVINKLIFKNRRRNVSYWFTAFCFMMLCTTAASQLDHIGTNILFSILIVTGADWFGRGLWALIKHHNKSVIGFVIVAITGIELIATGIFLGSEGTKKSFADTYLALGNKSVTQNDTTLSTSLGNEEVVNISYGMDKEDTIQSASIDLTSYAERSFLQGGMMKKHLGYELDAVPMAGSIWYPKDVNNCPVLFLVHGNHTIKAKSYLGYEYLAKYLASYGYVVVSIDENGCNELYNENDARAVLFLENMKQVLAFNKDNTNKLYGKIDESRIAIAGHSRGGETAATAYLFNDYDCYPDNGNLAFDYHFNIKSVMAIAPTVDQYMPAEHAVALSDVNYMIIQGANDHDVSSAMGEKQYMNVSYTGTGNYLKAMLYVADANHGQFNELWGKYDMGYPISSFLNVKNLISVEEQQDILKLFTKVYLDVTLNEDTTNLDLLKNCQSYANLLPKTLYQQMYQTSDFDCISNFEEDSNLNTATKDQVRISASNMKTWKEKKRSRGMTAESEDYVLQLEWEDTKDASVSYELPEYDMQNKSLVFDLSDQTEDMDDMKALIDGVITITDGAGNTASVKISDGVHVYPTLPVQLRKLDWLFHEYEYKHTFQTVTIPYEMFTASNAAIDCSKVVKLTINFDYCENGRIQLDNLGFD